MKKAIQYSLVVALGLAVAGCSKEESPAGTSGGSQNGLASVLGLCVGGSSKESNDNGDNGHKKVQLWKDGPYWAETNIGAEKPEDYGYYFWWGDTVGYKRKGEAFVASNGSSSNFLFERANTTTYGKDIDTLKGDGWVTTDGVLTPEHDAAHVHWGGDWRMPTKQEFDDLRNKCNWIWGGMNGVEGYVVRGKGDYSSASIFLPCVGYGCGSCLVDSGSRGDVWSSTPDSDNPYGAWYLDFHSSYFTWSYSYRNYGRSVRPVQGFTK